MSPDDRQPGDEAKRSPVMGWPSRHRAVAAAVGAATLACVVMLVLTWALARDARDHARRSHGELEELRAAVASCREELQRLGSRLDELARANATPAIQAEGLGRTSVAGSASATVRRDPTKCIMCLQCLRVCPTQAISEKGGSLVVDEKRCWRCGRCERVCPADAIHLEKRDKDEFQMALAEGTQAVLSTFAPGKVLYFNFVLEVQPECDCMPMADTPLVQDQGILASRDVVAIDQAALDLVNRAAPLPQSLAADRGLKQGERVLAEALGIDGEEHVKAAAQLGLGSRSYTLVSV